MSVSFAYVHDNDNFDDDDDDGGGGDVGGNTDGAHLNWS